MLERKFLMGVITNNTLINLKKKIKFESSSNLHNLTEIQVKKYLLYTYPSDIVFFLRTLCSEACLCTDSEYFPENSRYFLLLDDLLLEQNISNNTTPKAGERQLSMTISVSATVLII